MVESCNKNVQENACRAQASEIKFWQLTSPDGPIDWDKVLGVTKHYSIDDESIVV
jgi:uncharacterized protein YijF (DUF1287 family)